MPHCGDKDKTPFLLWILASFIEMERGSWAWWQTPIIFEFEVT